MDDIELYEFFKGFDCGYFSLNYSHEEHSWNIQCGNIDKEISKEDLLKLESHLKELELKYFPKQKEALEYIPD